jgi:glycosyltransferase involved in cell wall biosynthesis
MALGLPIVSSATAGPSEVLDDSIATLVAPGDATGLADALGSVIAAPEAAAAKARRASERFTALYSEAAVVEQYIQLYERLTAVRNPG